MSDQRHSPDNPFDRPGHAPHQVGGPSPQQPKSRVWLWVLGTVGVLVVLGAVVCCGGGYFAFQGVKGMLAQAVRDEVRGNPVIDEHLGPIESVEFNTWATAEEQQETPDALVYDVEGSKSSGTLVVHPEPGGDPQSISSIVLVLSDGTRHQVKPLDADANGSDEPTHSNDAADPAAPEPPKGPSESEPAEAEQAESGQAEADASAEEAGEADAESAGPDS